jgi:lipopolysaccharide export system permease protein
VFDGIYEENYYISMKKLIFSKFFLDNLNFFLIISITTSLIVWIIQAVNFLDFVTEDGHNFKIYMYYTLLNFPKIFSRVLPFVFFISLFYTLTKYENKNELIIFWINGITRKTFINTIIIYSFFFLILQILLTTYIVPASQNQARSFIRSSNIDFFPSLIKEKKFIDTVEGLTIFVNKKEKNILENIFLKEVTDEDDAQIIYAKKGSIINKNNLNFLILYEGEIININEKNVTSYSFEKTELNLSKYTTKSTTFPKIQELKSSALIECLKKLFTKNQNINIKFLKCNEDSKISVNQELIKRFYSPFFLPVIALITSILIFRSKDSSKYSQFRIKIFLYVLTLIIFSEISLKYAGLNKFSSLIFLSSPLIIFLINYILMLKKLNLLK